MCFSPQTYFTWCIANKQQYPFSQAAVPDLVNLFWTNACYSQLVAKPFFLNIPLKAKYEPVCLNPDLKSRAQQWNLRDEGMFCTKRFALYLAFLNKPTMVREA